VSILLNNNPILVDGLDKIIISSEKVGTNLDDFALKLIIQPSGLILLTNILLLQDV